MITSIDDWIQFLRQSQVIIALPLVISGLGMMLFGWRIARFCITVAMGAIGYIGVGLIPGLHDGGMFYALVACAVLGVGSFARPKEAAALLGGILGAGVLVMSLANLGLKGRMMWPVGGAALIAFTSFAALNRRVFAILTTSFQGALFFISGVATVVMAMPSLYATVRGMTGASKLVVPFIILVPTAMACFYQLADVRRVESPT
ncbi:MAG: hypothetical protein ACE5E6_06790 [Phycisphaerae bacterium]